MKINSDLFVSTYKNPQIQIKKFHIEMGKTFSTLPKDGKLLEVVKRVVIAILAPFVYLTLYTLILCKSMWTHIPSGSRNTGQKPPRISHYSSTSSIHSTSSTFAKPATNNSRPNEANPKFNIDQVESLDTSNQVLKSYPPICCCTIILNNNRRLKANLYAQDVRELIRALPSQNVKNYAQKSKYFFGFKQPSRSLSEILQSFN